MAADADNDVDAVRQYLSEVEFARSQRTLRHLLEWTETGIANHGERSCVQRKIKELLGET